MPQLDTNSSSNWAITRNQEIWAGVLLLFGGLLLLVMNWYDALYKGKFSAKATFAAPLAMAAGLMVLAIPFPAKEHFPKAEFIPKGWILFIFAGFAVGVLNWCYFMGIF